MIVAVCPKCGADLEALIYTTYPPIRAYRCRKCGWSQEERENITRVPIATAERKPLTNYDRLISKSPEEMAEWMAEVLFHCSNTICNERCPMYKCCCDQSSDNIEEWLKQEVKE